MRDDDAQALEAEVRALTTRELGQTVRFLLRARFLGVGVLGVLGVLTLLGGPAGWQAGFMFGAAAAIGGVAAWDRRRLAGVEVRPADHAWLLGSVMLIQTAIILPTGGAASPLQVAYVPVATLAGVGLGRQPYTFRLFGLALVLVWTFAVLAASGLGPEPAPHLLGLVPEAAPRAPYVWAQAALLSFAILVGGTFGMFHRGALDRAVRAAAVARREALAAIHARNREFHDLSHALAHELKNPLASIQGLAGLMARKLPEGGREAEQAGVILGEARRMGGIVDELSSFARPAQGLAVRPIVAERLAADLLTLHEGLASQRNVRLRLETEPGVPECRADDRKITQVLVNLLQNALEATPAGGSVTLRVGARAGGGVVFIVDDTGPGLAEQMRGRLFVAGATTKPTGNGLGLRIARAIAEQHGGTLRLEDRTGGGCRATLEIPTP